MDDSKSQAIQSGAARWQSSNGKSYTSIYLRESYRDGARVRKRDIANLTHCDPQEVAAIEMALKYKGDLSKLGSLDNIQLRQELSVGAVPPMIRSVGSPASRT